MSREIKLMLAAMAVFAAIAGSTPLPASGEERKYVEIQWRETGKPSIDLSQTGVPVVSLPTGLRNILGKNYRGYRLPDDRDYAGDWKDSYDYLSPEEQEGKKVPSRQRLIRQRAPFLALGDFNHDGTTDVAVFIIGVGKEVGAWKLVVFHSSKEGFQPKELWSVPKGMRDVPVHRYGIALKEKCSDGRSCLELYIFESFSYEFIWQRGRYVKKAIE